MNEVDEALVSILTRKKRRGFGFRFSSKKVLERSRLKRLANVRGCDVTFVTRTLSYPCLIPSEKCSSNIHQRVATPFESAPLVSIDEVEEARKEISNVGHFTDCEYPNSVSISS